jgi:hypothetical protein
VEEIDQKRQKEIVMMDDCLQKIKEIEANVENWKNLISKKGKIYNPKDKPRRKKGKSSSRSK